MEQMLAAGLPQLATLGGTALPLVGRARVYACGITPYDVTHLGHAATFVWVDTLARVLHAGGAEVIMCRNVTDVDDVLLAAASRAGSPYGEFAAIQQFYFDRDMAALGVRPPAIQPRAHAYIEQVIGLAAGLLARGMAYQRDGQVYFRGAAVAARAGVDRPTAMALHTFGPAVDVQAGGGDLRFPHHAFQAALAEAFTGVIPFARARLAAGVVRVGGAKMAKSAGNLVLVSELLGAYPAAVVRLLILDRRWDRDWDYDRAGLDAAAGRLERLQAAAGRPDRGAAGAGGAAVAAVHAALASDLDVPAALDIAEDQGGQAARVLGSVLGLW